MTVPLDPGPPRLDGLAAALVDAEQEVTRSRARAAARPFAQLTRLADAGAALGLLLPWTHGGTGSRDAFTLASGGSALVVLAIGLRQVALALMLALPGPRSRVVAALTCLASVATVAYCAVRVTAVPVARSVIVDGTPLQSVTGAAPSFAVIGPTLFLVTFLIGSYTMLRAGLQIHGVTPADLLADPRSPGREVSDPPTLARTIHQRHLAALRPPGPGAALVALGYGGLIVAAIGLSGPWMRLPDTGLDGQQVAFGARMFDGTTGLAYAISIGLSVCMLVATLRPSRALLAAAVTLTGAGCAALAWTSSAPMSDGFVRASGAWISIAGATITFGCGLFQAMLLQLHRTKA